MDQNEFSRRLRILAGPQDRAATAPVDEYTRILGSLGFVSAVRRAQAVALCALLMLAAICALHSIELSSKPLTAVLALSAAGVSVLILRVFPYWSPAGPLGEGLNALSRYPLNDLGEFIRNQRTDLSAVNNTLLSDLCLQLAMDSRRVKTHPQNQ